ncbi:MAG: hypothetical protein VKI42_03215, partial [Synechococcaceae cyanobacterium]|nr:hypothetical protein [Synechococcaceae cyanobacterium]
MAALPAVLRSAVAASLSTGGLEPQCAAIPASAMAASAMAASATAASPTAVQERSQVRSPYPNYRITVLDDDVNTFQHVVDSLVKILPG